MSSKEIQLYKALFNELVKKAVPPCMVYDCIMKGSHGIAEASNYEYTTGDENKLELALDGCAHEYMEATIGF